MTQIIPPLWCPKGRLWVKTNPRRLITPVDCLAKESQTTLWAVERERIPKNVIVWQDKQVCLPNIFQKYSLFLLTGLSQDTVWIYLKFFVVVVLASFADATIIPVVWHESLYFFHTHTVLIDWHNTTIIFYLLFVLTVRIECWISSNSTCPCRYVISCMQTEWVRAFSPTS